MTVRVPIHIAGEGVRVRHIEVGGVNLADYARSARLDMGVGSVPALQVELLARQGFDVTLDAAVQVAITLLPGFVLEEQRCGDAVTYRAVREPVSPSDDGREGGSNLQTDPA